MKITLVIYSVIMFSNTNAQNWPAYKALRYDEDYSFLKNDTVSGWYRRLKFAPLNEQKDTYLSMGGDIRYQYLFIHNESWGEARPDDDGFILTRWLVHADLHIKRNVRLFVEMQSCMANSRADLPPPIENNPLELHQAFVDFNCLSSQDLTVTLRAGRQEFLYGSQRLVSVRDAPNARQSFDGVNAILKNHKGQLNVFFANYVTAQAGIFDDVSSHDRRFWGVYFAQKITRVLRNLETYYIGYDNRGVVLDDGSGRELRHSIGMRLWDVEDDWNYDIEFIFQGGHLDRQKISAWGLSLKTSYVFRQSILRPEIGVKTEVITGNRKYSDDKVETANPLFPQGAYFGLAVPIAPSNLMDIHPSISINVSRSTRISLDYAIIWRQSRNDGIYRGNMSLIYTGKASESRYVGGQLSTTFIYPANNFILVICGFSWFDPQRYLKEAGKGKDTVLGFATLQVKF